MEQKKRKRRKKRTKKRSAISKVGLFFLILLLVLLLLGITVSAGWLWMNYSGQSRLSQKQEAIPVSWKGLYLQKGYSDLFVFRN